MGLLRGIWPIARAAVNPSMDAAGSDSCVSRLDYGLSLRIVIARSAYSSDIVAVK